MSEGASSSAKTDPDSALDAARTDEGAEHEAANAKAGSDSRHRECLPSPPVDALLGHELIVGDDASRGSLGCQIADRPEDHQRVGGRLPHRSSRLS